MQGPYFPSFQNADVYIPQHEDWMYRGYLRPKSDLTNHHNKSRGQLCCFIPGCVSMKSKEMGPF